MLVKTYGSAVFGLEATTITIEVNVCTGVNFILVGLPDSAVKESQQRVKAAIKNIGFKFPGKEITVNMAPADIRKEGSTFDVPIALGILAASEQLNISKLDQFIILGELSLDGHIQAMKGILPIAIPAKKDGYKGIIVPKENAEEAAIVHELEVYGVETLNEVIDFLNDTKELTPTEFNIEAEFEKKLEELSVDFSDVKGQLNIKRLPTILPPMSMEEALETTKIHSVAGKMGKKIGLVTERPFRKPHHTISNVALVGGGGYPQPGEISLAHNGVLFLDELPEYQRTVLEVMRQPLEDRSVSISRAKFTVDYPASFMLIAAMNPCPCGFFNHPEKKCVCGNGVVQKYLNRISGPLLDRIDLHVEVTPISYDELTVSSPQEGSKAIRTRVIEARLIQKIRFEKSEGVHCNAQMTTRDLENFCKLEPTVNEILKNAMDRLGLSARAYDRILKVARTIADLDKHETINASHISEAIQFRSLDRNGWGS